MALAADIVAVSGSVVCVGCLSKLRAGCAALHIMAWAVGFRLSLQCWQLSCEHGGLCMWMLSYPHKVLGVSLVCCAFQEDGHSLQHRMIERCEIELYFWIDSTEIMRNQVLREAAPCSGNFGEPPVARIVVVSGRVVLWEWIEASNFWKLRPWHIGLNISLTVLCGCRRAFCWRSCSQRSASRLCPVGLQQSVPLGQQSGQSCGTHAARACSVALVGCWMVNPFFPRW